MLRCLQRFLCTCERSEDLRITKFRLAEALATKLKLPQSEEIPLICNNCQNSMASDMGLEQHDSLQLQLPIYLTVGQAKSGYSKSQ